MDGESVAELQESLALEHFINHSSDYESSIRLFSLTASKKGKENNSIRP